MAYEYRTSFTAADRADREETIVDGRFSSVDRSLVDGLEAQGALYFADDKNTGIYSPQNDEIALTTAGEEAFRLNSNQNAFFYKDINIESDFPRLYLTDTGNHPDYSIYNGNGIFTIKDESNNRFPFRVYTSGVIQIDGNLDATGGIDVTGDGTFTGDVSLNDGKKLQFGDPDLTIYHNGTTHDTYIDDQGAGQLRLCSNELVGLNAAHGEYTFKAFEGGAVELYYANQLRLKTGATSQGVSLHHLNAGTGDSDLRYSSSTGEIFYDTSSRLVKTDIEDSPYGIDTVKQLKPRKYKRTDQETNPIEIGFVADEVQPLIPEIVPIGPKSNYTKEESDTELIPINVDYRKLTVVLTTALQEAIAKIETLETKVAALESS